MDRPDQQKGCFSVFYGPSGSPLQNWALHTKNGHSKRVYDDDVKSTVFELLGTNVSTTYMEIPRIKNKPLNIKLPFLVLLVKNLSKYFTFEVKILDDQNLHRCFRFSNSETNTSFNSACTVMTMGMSPGWNRIHLDLADFTRRIYGTTYMKTVQLQIHANTRIRRIYFADRHYTDDELPIEFRLVAKPKECKWSRNVTVTSDRSPSPTKFYDQKSDIETNRSQQLETTNMPAVAGAGQSSKRDLAKFRRSE